MFDYTRLPNPKGHVELIETIGKGNFGFVYRAKLTETKEQTAVKVVLIKQEELREILLEVEILRDCSHENITKFMGCFWRGDDLWICMEFCGAGAVDSLYKNLFRSLRQEDEIAIFMSESLKGLDYLHKERHIIHRDIKSGNILLTEDGQIKLADFGVSALCVKENGYRAHSFIGTPYWMAPEVIMAENAANQLYDCKADVWSIGITAIELNDKNPPMSDIHPMRALRLIPTADSSVLMIKNPKKANKLFVQFIQSCLIKDPKKRPSCQDVLKLPYFQEVHEMGPEKRRKIIADLVVEAKEDKRKRKQGLKPPETPSVEIEDDDEGEFFEDFGASSKGNAVVESKNGQAGKSSNAAAAGQKASSSAVKINVTAASESDQYGTANSDKGLISSSSTSGENRGSNLNVSDSQSKISGPASPGNIVNAFANMFKRVVSHSHSSSSGGSDDDIIAYDQKDVEDGIIDMTSLVGRPGFEAPFECLQLDAKIKTEVYCADVVTVVASSGAAENDLITYHFLLIGTDRGLLAADVSSFFHSKEKLAAATEHSGNDGSLRVRMLISNLRVKQLAVLEDYNVLVALAGKFSQIRSYILPAIKKLIRYVYSIDFKGKPAEKEDLGMSEHVNLMNHHGEHRTESPATWINDFSKVLNTRDSQSFIITRTKSTIYMGIMFRSEITVFEWAKLPYLRFMKVKTFWLPEMPKFFEIMHDGNVVTDILVVYEKEANRIEFESSKVHEINVDGKIKGDLAKDVTKDKDQNRWLGWIQLPDGSSSSNGNAQKDSPQNAPSWYDTIKSMKPKSKSTEANSHVFLATYGNRSVTANLDGKPVQNTKQKTVEIVEWGTVQVRQALKKGEDPLAHLSPRRLIVQSPLYLVGQHKNYFEILSFVNGSCGQVLKAPHPIKMLTPYAGSDNAERRRGRLFFQSWDKKKKISRIYLLKEKKFNVNENFEAMARYDRNMKPIKVLGTGSIVSAII